MRNIRRVKRRRRTIPMLTE